MNGIPFQTIDRDQIEKTEHPGTSGKATWQTIDFSGLRIRLVKYSAGYFANQF